MFFYTDGVTGAISNDEKYSREQLLDILIRFGTPAASVEAILKDINKEVSAYITNEAQEDDISMLGMRFHNFGQMANDKAIH